MSTAIEPPPAKKGGFEEAWKGRDRVAQFSQPPDLLNIRMTEFRFATGSVLAALAAGDWLRMKHYSQFLGGIVRLDDLEALIGVGSSEEPDQLIATLSTWKRLGPDTSLVRKMENDEQFMDRLSKAANLADIVAALAAWRRCGADGTLINVISEPKAPPNQPSARNYVRRVEEFAMHTPLFAPDGSVRSVEFSDEVIREGELSLKGSVEGGLYLQGNIDRFDNGVAITLELPTGESVELTEDGNALTLSRTPLASPVALLDIQVRAVRL